MRRHSPLVLIAVPMLAVIVWLVQGQEPRPAANGGGDPDGVESPTAPMTAPVEVTRQPEPEPDAVALERVVASPTPEWEPDARGDLTVRVVDASGRPVAGATVTFWALRSKQSPGSHYGWRGEQPSGNTDSLGEVSLWFPVWVAERNETSVVTVRADHPYFVSKNEDIPIEMGDHEIVLEHGAFVTVSGWIDSPDRMVTDVWPRVTDRSAVHATDWVRLAGRKPSTHKMADGHHALYIQHDAGGERYYSDVVEFDLTKGDVRDFHLELKRARSLHGRLAETVPRPVRNGAVMLNLFVLRGAARASREFSTDVAADGTFVFDRLPRGSGQIIARCDGWVSDEVLPAPDPQGAAVRAPEPELQRVEIEDDIDDYVLAMRPAATFVARVKGPDDEAVPSARVVLWPNVHWGHGYSDIFMSDTYETRTDVNGVAVVRNLPPGDESFRVTAPGLQMLLAEQGYGSAERQGRVDLKSGETVELEVRLERKPGG